LDSGDFQISLRELLLVVAVFAIALGAVGRLEAALWFRMVVAAYFTGLALAACLVVRGLRRPRAPTCDFSRRSPRHLLSTARVLRRRERWIVVPWTARLGIVVAYAYIYIFLYIWVCLLGEWSAMRDLLSDGSPAGFSIRAILHTIHAVLVAYLVPVGKIL